MKESFRIFTYLVLFSGELKVITRAHLLENPKYAYIKDYFDGNMVSVGFIITDEQGNKLSGVQCTLDEAMSLTDELGYAEFFGLAQGAHTYSVAMTGGKVVAGVDPFGRPLGASGTLIIEWLPDPTIPWPATQIFIVQFTMTPAEIPDFSIPMLAGIAIAGLVILRAR